MDELRQDKQEAIRDFRIYETGDFNERLSAICSGDL